ncbi:MAG: HEAT repeat domain-containing protein [Phycisphaerae bacterium]
MADKFGPEFVSKLIQGIGRNNRFYEIADLPLFELCDWAYSRFQHSSLDAAFALASWGCASSEVLSYLRAVARDGDLETRVPAAIALLRAGDRSGRQVLINELDSDFESYLKPWVAGELCACNVTRVIDRMKEEIGYAEDYAVCAVALGRGGETAVRDDLIRILEEPECFEDRFQTWAIRSLGYVGLEEDVILLESIADSSKGIRRRSALMALATISEDFSEEQQARIRLLYWP